MQGLASTSENHTPHRPPCCTTAAALLVWAAAGALHKVQHVFCYNSPPLHVHAFMQLLPISKACMRMCLQAAAALHLRS